MARSSKFFIVLILLALEITGIWTHDIWPATIPVLSCCYGDSQLKASVVWLKFKVNVNVCLQRWNLRAILKRDNLTFSNKDSNSKFHLFQNTRLICPLFCEFLCGNYVWSWCSSFAHIGGRKGCVIWQFLMWLFNFVLLLVLNGIRDKSHSLLQLKLLLSPSENIARISLYSCQFGG